MVLVCLSLLYIWTVLCCVFLFLFSSIVSACCFLFTYHSKLLCWRGEIPDLLYRGEQEEDGIYTLGGFSSPLFSFSSSQGSRNLALLLFVNWVHFYVGYYINGFFLICTGFPNTSKSVWSWSSLYIIVDHCLPYVCSKPLASHVTQRICHGQWKYHLIKLTKTPNPPMAFEYNPNIDLTRYGSEGGIMW